MNDDFLLNNDYSSVDNHNTINIDQMFNSLSNDITNFNKVISNISQKKKDNDNEYKELLEERERINTLKLNFDAYVKRTNDEFSRKNIQIKEYMEGQKLALAKSELEFKNSMATSFKELEISKKEIELQKQKFKEEKDQFEEYKNLELNRIKHKEEMLNSDKEQFEKYKDVCSQKMELENRNLEQKCSKFKDLITQFNSNFKPIVEEE